MRTRLDARGQITSFIKTNSLVRSILWPILAVRRWRSRQRSKPREQVIEDIQVLLACDPVLRVPEFLGEFRVDARSDLFKRIVRSKQYEPNLSAAVISNLDRSGDAIDVGANIGFYTVLLGRLVGEGRTIVACEPVEAAFEKLCENVSRNNVADKIILRRIALSDKSGDTYIKTIAGREEYSTLGAQLHQSAGEFDITFESVPTRTLDEIVRDLDITPRFIKIDVEGLEYAVLKGGAETLVKHRPLLLVEVNDDLARMNGWTANNLIQFLAQHNYEMFDPDQPFIPARKIRAGNLLCKPL